MLSVSRLYGILLDSYGLQGWWPVSDEPFSDAVYRNRSCLTEQQRFEICVGALLAQNTNWNNAAKAIVRLKNHRVFLLDSICSLSSSRLAADIKSAGFFNQKADRIQRFCELVKNRHGFFSCLFAQPVDLLRNELLAVKGIGPETCDSMLLYAGQKPVFVVDAYSRRLVERVYGKKMGYAACQSFFEAGFEKNPVIFAEFHALIVAHAKKSCRVKPLCNDCVLKRVCGFAKRA